MTETSKPLKFKIVGNENTKNGVSALFDAENFYDNLNNKKLLIDYAMLHNSLNPQFIPTLRDEVKTPPPVLNAGDTLNTFYIGNLTVNLTNYFIYLVRKPTSSIGTDKNGVANVQWAQPNINIPVPTTIPIPPPQTYYLNPYYQVNRYTHFLDMIKQAFFNLCGTLALPIPIFQFVINQNGVSLQISTTITDHFYLYMNDDLIKLLGFKRALYLQPLDDFYGIELLNSSVVDIGNQDCLVATNEFIPNQILPFDEIFFSSNLPIRLEEQHSNELTGGRNTNKSYKNVVLSFYPLSNNPLNTMPKFIYTTESSNTKYMYFSENEFTQSLFSLQIFLYNSRLDVAIPYKLDKDELVILKGRVITEL